MAITKRTVAYEQIIKICPMFFHEHSIIDITIEEIPDHIHSYIHRHGLKNEIQKGKEEIEILTIVKKGWKKIIKKIGVMPKRKLFIPENRIRFFPKGHVEKEWTGYKNGIYWELLDIIIADKETVQNPRITMALRLFHECWHAMRGSQRIHEAIDEALTGIATKNFYRSVVCVHPFFEEEIRHIRKQKIKIDTTRTKEALCLWNALCTRTPNKKSAHYLLHSLFRWQITGSKRWLPEEIDRVELAAIEKEIAQELRG